MAKSSEESEVKEERVEEKEVAEDRVEEMDTTGDKGEVRDEEGEKIEEREVMATLLLISSVTSKTFIVSKVYIFGNSGRICQIACNLPFVHAKFQRTGSSRLAST